MSCFVPVIMFAAEFCRAHLHREQAGKVVLPVVSGCNDNSLLHAVVLDGAYGCSHIEICYSVENQ